jgi:FtsP/CotA-like multicopper oxidase with cupredoxin domain
MTTPRFTRRVLVGGALVSLAALGSPARAEAPAKTDPTPRRLELRAGTAKLRGGDREATAVWGFEGAVPGPVLKVKRGGEVWVTAANELPVPTAIHWHGLRLDNRMDGVPPLTQAAIRPGSSFDYRFACPDAGTFWYHPEVGQLGRGLAGALIVEEDEPPTVDQDLVLLLQDWTLTEAGALDPALDAPAGPGQIGPLATLNGQPAQDIAVKANDRLRLRLINAATTRIAGFGFEGGLKPVVVAIDGQPAEAFELARPFLALAPGGRVDLIVDMPAAAPEMPALRLGGYGAEAVLARFIIDPGAPRRPDQLGKVAELPANPLPRTIELKGAHRVELPMDGAGKEPSKVWTFQAEAGDAGPPLFSVPRGRAVVLALANRTRLPHVVHLHGHSVRLLDSLDDGWKPWWHDTLLVGEERTARIAFIADNPGKWLIECRGLGPQPTSLAAWFEVT